MLWRSPGVSRSSKSFVIKTTSDIMGKASAKSYPSCSSTSLTKLVKQLKQQIVKGTAVLGCA